MMYLRLHRWFWRPFQCLPRAARRALAAAAGAVAGTRRPALDRVADILGRSARGQELFWSSAHSFWNVHKDRLLTRDLAGGGWPELEEAGIDAGPLAAADSGAVIGAMLADFDGAHPGRDMLTRMIHVEMKMRLAELLLMRVDKITMANSVEGRVPFLDQRLVEFTMDIPAAWKVRGGTKKYLLKKALDGILPAEIIHRPKMGFGAPMAEWLRSGFGHEAEAGVLGSELLTEFGFDRDHIRVLFRDHRDGRRDNALHLWTLFNLTAWHDHWITGKAAGTGRSFRGAPRRWPCPAWQRIGHAVTGPRPAPAFPGATRRRRP